MPGCDEITFVVVDGSGCLCLGGEWRGQTRRGNSKEVRISQRVPERGGDHGLKKCERRSVGAHPHMAVGGLGLGAQG